MAVQFYRTGRERAIMKLLKNFSKNRNQFIHLSSQLRNDNYQIVIKVDKVPSGEHAGRFNEPNVDEVAVIRVGDPVNSRDLRFTSRDSTVNTISDKHRTHSNIH